MTRCSHFQRPTTTSIGRSFSRSNPHDSFERVEQISAPDFNVGECSNRFPDLIVQHTFIDRQQIDVVRGSWKSSSSYCRSADQRERDLLFFEKPGDAFDESHVSRLLCCVNSGGRFDAPRESAPAPLLSSAHSRRNRERDPLHRSRMRVPFVQRASSPASRRSSSCRVSSATLLRIASEYTTATIRACAFELTVVLLFVATSAFANFREFTDLPKNPALELGAAACGGADAEGFSEADGGQSRAQHHRRHEAGHDRSRRLAWRRALLSGLGGEAVHHGRGVSSEAGGGSGGGAGARGDDPALGQRRHRVPASTSSATPVPVRIWRGARWRSSWTSAAS